MSAVAVSYLDEAIDSLGVAVGAGAPALPGSSKAAIGLLDGVERARRLGAVLAVDALEEIERSGSFYDHGHANARVMFAHVTGASGSEAHRLDKIRRMIGAADVIGVEWRQGRLGVDKAALLGRAFANPRTRDRFMIDQRYFVKQARRFSFKRFEKIVARWLEVHDDDGSDPPSDPSHERRSFSVRQDHFSQAWHVEGSLGSLQGSQFNETHAAYVQAEFAHDWAAAEAIHGKDTCRDLLGRSDAQRRADALCQMAADAVNSARPSAPVQRVHNIVWTAETYEALLLRWSLGNRDHVHGTDVDRRIDPERYGVTDIDGNTINIGGAFADSLVSKVRRVVRNAAGVTINMSKDVRLFTGLARLGVTIDNTECYWAGCHVPASRCHIDHLKPAARGGTTEQHNGLPACPRHNRFKERGYTVTRAPDGTIIITTPDGEQIT